MVQIAWNAPGERRYEAGCDRAVFYPPDAPGVAWNGLISVNEDPVGGGSTPLHFDGVMYHNQIAGQDFQATIEAYTYPREFEPFDGYVKLAPGFSATLQPRRRRFGLCYRTGLGNDLEDLEYGYKLHLVYNAIAEPTKKSAQSLGAVIDPENFSWTMVAVPPPATTYKPTAHFVVDSTETDPRIMEVLEQRLYGVATNIPYLPTPAFVAELMNAMNGTIDGGTPFTSGEMDLDGGSPGNPSTDVYDGGQYDTLTVEDYVYS